MKFGLSRASISILSIVMLLLLATFAFAQDEWSTVPSLFQYLKDNYGQNSEAIVSAEGTAPSEKQYQEAHKDAKLLPLEKLASLYCLRLFQQDGIFVLAPAKRPDLTDLAKGRAKPIRPLSMLINQLVFSMTNRQLRLLGSQNGLPFSELTTDQQKIMAEIFSGPRAVVPVEPGQNADLSKAKPAEKLDIKNCYLTAHLSVDYLTIQGPQSENQRYPFGSYFNINCTQPRSKAGWVLADLRIRDEGGYRLRRMPPPWEPKQIDNCIKESDLNFSLKALNKPIQLSGTTTISELSSVISNSTGIKLYASPGSNNIQLYVQGRGVSAGRLLKAVALATTGTWRRFEDGYIFSVDRMGIGQIAARYRELQNKLTADQQNTDNKTSDSIKRHNILTMLPLDLTGRFKLGNQQLESLVLNDAAGGLTWDSIKPTQKAFIEKELITAEGRGSLPADRKLVSVIPNIVVKLTFNFQNPGPVELSWEAPGGVAGVEIFPIRNTSYDRTASLKDAESGTRVVLNSPMRACVWKPAAGESPEFIAKSLKEHGFNNLFLRVFTSGYTAFPSRNFPMMQGLDQDYLKRVIIAAHNQGIKVFAVLDVLRWSDGTNKNWVRKEIRLLDFDIFSRTRSESLAATKISDADLSDLEFYYGEGTTGDAVNPANPEVSVRLRALLDELSAYEIDGLALDYTSMLIPTPRGSMRYGSSLPNPIGNPGHNDVMQREFFIEFGADSIDIPEGPIRNLDWLPLQQIVSACTELQGQWELLYRTACDNLLDSLLRRWNSSKKNSPVWLIDTFGIERPSHDLSGFKKRIQGVIRTFAPYSTDEDGYYNEDFEIIPIIRATERVGTARFANTIISLQSPGFSSAQPLAAKGIVVDLTAAGKRKIDYLTLITSPEEKSQ